MTWYRLTPSLVGITCSPSGASSMDSNGPLQSRRYRSSTGPSCHALALVVEPKWRWRTLERDSPFLMGVAACPLTSTVWSRGISSTDGPRVVETTM